MDTSETSPMACMATSIERKTPIREFLFMQNNILSMILWKVPISLMEPREFLERRLDPLLFGLWINMKSHRFITISKYNICYQSSLLHTLGIRILCRSFLSSSSNLRWILLRGDFRQLKLRIYRLKEVFTIFFNSTSDLSWSSSIFFPFYFIIKKLFPIAMCWWLHCRWTW